MKEVKYHQWIQYAEADLRSALSHITNNDFPGHVIFHCHDALEKYLKAILLKNNFEIEYIHKLKNLVVDTPLSESDKLQLENTFIVLDELYILARYPSKTEEITVEHAKDAYDRTLKSVHIFKKYL